MAELPIQTSATRDAIFAAYEAQSGDGFRPHLGASLIGVVESARRITTADFRERPARSRRAC